MQRTDSDGLSHGLHPASSSCSIRAWEIPRSFTLSAAADAWEMVETAGDETLVTGAAATAIHLEWTIGLHE